LGHAESNRVAKANANAKAEEMLQKRGAQQQEAQKAFNATGEKLNDDVGTLEKERNASAPERLIIQEVKNSLEKQKIIVESLKSRSTSLRRSVNATQHEYTVLQETITQDSSCKDALLDGEDKVRNASRTYNLTHVAWQASPENEDLRLAAWDALDVLTVAKYHEYLSQKDCAPNDLDIPPVSPPAPCGNETPGTCQLLGCDETRRAHCDPQTHKCLCTRGYCAKDGGCQSRGPPTIASANEARSAQGIGPESPNGSWMFLVPLVTVLLAAVAIAFVLQKRCAFRRVESTPYLRLE